MRSELEPCRQSRHVYSPSARRAHAPWRRTGLEGAAVAAGCAVVPVNGAHVGLCGGARHSARTSRWRARAIDEPRAAAAAARAPPGFEGVIVQSQTFELPFG